MEKSCLLSENTKTYLTEFYTILDRMIEGMTHAKLDNSISHNFIVQMIPHHHAAVEMSENVLKYTKNCTLRRIADNIVVTQTEGIADMESILNRCSTLENNGQDIFLYQKRLNLIIDIMFKEMNSAYCNNNITASFAREMIPHHEGAIRMSENALRYNICPELRPVLCNIIRTQSQGVRQLKALLQRVEM